MTRSKYGNRITYVDGIKFASQAEALRYQELKLMLYAGEISNLRLQPRYDLQPAFTTISGKRIRAIKYVGDFEYIDNVAQQLITEDVKGVETSTFKLKHKMFMFKYGREIKLVRAR